MVQMRDVEHVFVYKDPELAHACNQVSIVALQNGELLMGFNEERYPVHADSGAGPVHLLRAAARRAA